MSERRYITVAEAAQRLMATPENVRRMIWSGRLEGERVAGTQHSYRVLESSVERLLEDGGYVPGMTQASD